jgi:hypothetical protein
MQETTCGHDVYYANGLCKNCYYKIWNSNNKETVKRGKAKFLADNPDYYKRYCRNWRLRKKAKARKLKEEAERIPILKDNIINKTPVAPTIVRHDDENRTAFLKRFCDENDFPQIK